MIETTDLILDKAKYSDWEAMFKNVWSHEQSARYMFWEVTKTEEEAKDRILRTIDFQKTHEDAFLIYKKPELFAIGFAGAECVKGSTYRETGICFGPDYVGRGYGKQVLSSLIDYCKEKYNASEMLYSAREENVASNALARSFGFEPVGKEDSVDKRNGQGIVIINYSLKI